MKKLFLLILTTLTLSLGSSANLAFADVNDFYFKSFTGDYYLDNNSNGAIVTMSTDDAIDLYFSGEKKDTAKEISDIGNQGNLKIEETLVAVFPTMNQNHGIERCIPANYRGVGALDPSSIVVRQDGLSASFTKLTTSDGFICLRIGDADKYVFGEVTYEISYNYNNVIVQYLDADYQELYWDTNGTSWSQQFNTLVARLHLTDELYSALKPDQKLVTPFSCYVGSYGESGSDRCKISESTNGSDHIITFETLPISETYRRDTSTGRNVHFSGVKAGENLTMNVMFKNGTFSAITQTKSVLLIGVMLILTGIFISVIAILLKKRKKQADKISAAKAPTPVQYTPMPNMTVAQMKEIYLKSTRGSANVATLIELAVRHKIELEKGEKKRFGGYHWKVHVKNLDDVVREQVIVLEILNGGKTVHAGDTIEVKSHTATSKLQRLARNFGEEVEQALESKKLFDKDTKTSNTGLAISAFLLVFLAIFGFSGFVIAFETLTDLAKNTGNVIYIGGSIFPYFVIITFFAFTAVASGITLNTSKYKKRTLKGIEASKYLDGLKEYMELAEADRLKFLQSVDGADTTHNGVVKLYEKLLPYAVIFGIEESWMSELNKYYQFDDVHNPDWVTAGVLLSASDFRTFNTYTNSAISSSTMSSSSGSSSGFSGGGGGGFSGGGGGGGGGGGW